LRRSVPSRFTSHSNVRPRLVRSRIGWDSSSTSGAEVAALTGAGTHGASAHGEDAPPSATRSAHGPGRDHLLGTDRKLFLDGRWDPTLTARARTANDLARPANHCAVIRAPTGPATAGGARRRSWDVGPGRSVLAASGDVAATRVIRRRHRRDAAAAPEQRSAPASE